MNLRNLPFSVVLIALLAMACLLAVGCSDDDDGVNPPVAKAPDLPPMSSFIMDRSDFEDGSGSAPIPGNSLVPQTRKNWTQSAVRVWAWNLALAVTFVVPTAAFIESFNHDPVIQPDTSFEWAYSVILGNDTFTCRLNGKVVDDEVQWKMYISKLGEFSDYLWYSGSHDIEATVGNWIVNRAPDEVNPFIRIDWHRNPSDGTGDLKYTDIVPEGAGNGNYIFYGSNTNPDYDRFYHIYNKGEDNLAEIEWNYSTKAGRVKDEMFYSDVDWHCWDGNLDDVDCP